MGGRWVRVAIVIGAVRVRAAESLSAFELPA
jgi:hypothetical protein